MKLANLLAVTLLLVLAHQTSGRVLSRCQLAQELLQHGISKKDLPNWVCIAEKESQGNTKRVRGPGIDGSYDFGLFLISDNYWCAHGKPGKECAVECEDLLADDITASIDCAKQIFAVHGYGGWQCWAAKCRGNLPDLTDCFEN